MLNLAIGGAENREGVSAIATKPGVMGHALYGPYDTRSAGDYVVEFVIEPLRDAATLAPDARCVMIEVTTDGGHCQLARRELTPADFANGATRFLLRFAIGEPTELEYRAWVSGDLPVRIEDGPQVAKRIEEIGDSLTIERARFPASASLPFFVQHRDYFRGLYDGGALVRIEGDAVILTIRDISFLARDRDDLNFVGEVLFENVYNFQLDRPSCVIDIGMNIGLSSLQFAYKEQVGEVHSFEPFRSTYARALANLALNPAAAAKVNARNFGLSDRNFDGEIIASQTSDSGAMMTIDAADGVPIRISVRHAGEVLTPIIQRARARGLDVIVKADCEGSEFAIFECLTQAGLLRHVTAFMVEWHAMFDDKRQADIAGPLRAAGFVIFDRSPPRGNGFFYAANLRRTSRAAATVRRWRAAIRGSRRSIPAGN